MASNSNPRTQPRNDSATFPIHSHQSHVSHSASDFCLVATDTASCHRVVHKLETVHNWKFCFCLLSTSPSSPPSVVNAQSFTFAFYFIRSVAYSRGAHTVPAPFTHIVGSTRKFCVGMWWLLVVAYVKHNGRTPNNSVTVVSALLRRKTHTADSVSVKFC